MTFIKAYIINNTGKRSCSKYPENNQRREKMKKAKKQVKPVKKVAVKSKKSKKPVVLKKKIAVKSKVTKKVKAKPVKAVKAKKAAVKKAPAGQATILGSVLGAIKKSKNGVAIGKIKEKTGLEQRQLSNALYKLSKNGKIKVKVRGIYIAK